MKQIFSTILAIVLGMGMANAEGIDITFNSNEAPAGVTFGGEVTYTDGHAVVELALQNNDKYRADFTYTGSFTLDPTQSKVLAIKFIGERPAGNMTLEIQYKGADDENVWMNSKWKNKPDGSVTTNAGNYIYYYNLSKDEAYTTTLDCVSMKIKIADCPDAGSYTLDWIKTFASVEALEAGKNVNDDDNDNDEGAELKVGVDNTTTGINYANIYAAVEAANEGDVLTVNSDQTIAARLNLTTSMTIKAAQEGITFNCENNNGVIILNNTANVAVAFSGLTFDGSARTGKPTVESQKGDISLSNCQFRGFANGTATMLSAKNGGHFYLDNTTFTDCTADAPTGLLFIGANGSTINGNVEGLSIRIEKDYNIGVAKDGTLTNTTPIVLYGADDRNYDKVFVTNCTDADKFKSGMNEKEAVAKDGGIYLVDEDTSGIDDLGLDAAPAEYYNLQGIRVDNPTSGIYLRRQGSKVTKIAL